MKFFNGEAVILRKYPIREKDEILLVLTKSFGKMSLVAHGSRDPMGKKTSAVELFNTIAFQAREPGNKKAENKHNLAVIQQVKLLKSRGFGVVASGEDNLAAFYRTTEILKLTDYFLKEMQYVEGVYEDLNTALDLFLEPNIGLIYKIRLYSDLGYVPDWSQCCVCNKKLALEGELRYFPDHHGFVHDRCAEIGSGPVACDMVKLMSFWQKAGMADGVRVEVEPGIIVGIENVLNGIQIE